MSRVHNHLHVFRQRVDGCTGHAISGVHRAAPLIDRSQVFTHAHRLRIRTVRRIVNRLVSRVNRSACGARRYSTLLLSCHHTRTSLRTHPGVDNAARAVARIRSMGHRDCNVRLNIVRSVCRTNSVGQARTHSLEHGVCIVRISTSSNV